MVTVLAHIGAFDRAATRKWPLQLCLRGHYDGVLHKHHPIICRGLIRLVKRQLYGAKIWRIWGSPGPYRALPCGASAVPLLHFRHGPHMAKWGCVCGPLAEPTLWQLGTFLSSLKWYFGAPFIFMLSLYFSRVCFFFSFFPFRSFPFFSFLLCRFFFQYYSLPFSL